MGVKLLSQPNMQLTPTWLGQGTMMMNRASHLIFFYKDDFNFLGEG